MIESADLDARRIASAERNYTAVRPPSAGGGETVLAVVGGDVSRDDEGSAPGAHG